MTGKVIDFHRHLKRAPLYHQQPVPRGPAERPAAKASVDRQIARIAYLLRELEDMARSGERLPRMLVVEAHASIERTRKMLQSWPDAPSSGKTDAPSEDAGQPNIDHALLERMYVELGLRP